MKLNESVAVAVRTSDEDAGLKSEPQDAARFCGSGFIPTACRDQSRNCRSEVRPTLKAFGLLLWLLLGLSPMSVAAADNAGKIFGNTHTFAGTEFTPVGLVGSDTISGVTLTSTGAAATANVGAYAIIPSNAVFSIGSASNYSITYVNGVLTITPASPTVVQEIAAISLGTRTPEGESRDEDREDVLAWMEGEGDQGDGLPDNLPVCR